MPIEIKELEIKASLMEDQPGAASAGPALNKEEIIEEAIERMLQILRDKNEM